MEWLLRARVSVLAEAILRSKQIYTQAWLQRDNHIHSSPMGRVRHVAAIESHARVIFVNNQNGCCGWGSCLTTFQLVNVWRSGQSLNLHVSLHERQKHSLKREFKNSGISLFDVQMHSIVLLLWKTRQRCHGKVAYQVMMQQDPGNTTPWMWR